MTAEKILKYDVIGKLSKFTPITDAVNNAIMTEDELDSVIQPSGTTKTTKASTELSEREKKLLGLGDDSENKSE